MRRSMTRRRRCCWRRASDTPRPAPTVRQAQQSSSHAFYYCAHVVELLPRPTITPSSPCVARTHRTKIRSLISSRTSSTTTTSGCGRILHSRRISLSTSPFHGILERFAAAAAAGFGTRLAPFMRSFVAHVIVLRSAGSGRSGPSPPGNHRGTVPLHVRPLGALSHASHTATIFSTRQPVSTISHSISVESSHPSVVP